jgi:hypothetical protein
VGWGGKPNNMDIPTEVQKCVVFVGYRPADGTERLAGSAFFVMKLTPEKLPLLGVRYVVTARHVVQGIRDKGIDKVLLRVNRKSGDAAWIETRVKDWNFHPDKAIDVAVLPFEPFIGFDHNLFSTTGFVTPEVVTNEQIGVGNEVFIVGLFNRHYGEKNNIPIVRVGNIAAMPGEKVNAGLGPMDAYLIEARSIGGLSGSPVFLPLGTRRSMTGLAMSPGQLQRYYLLGLIHGHFDVREDDLVDELVSEDAASAKSVNMGIAIVVPIEKVMETIEQPNLIEWEAALERKKKELLSHPSQS